MSKICNLVNKVKGLSEYREYDLMHNSVFTKKIMLLLMIEYNEHMNIVSLLNLLKSENNMIVFSE